MAEEQLFLEKYTSRFYTVLFLSLSLLLSLNFFRPSSSMTFLYGRLNCIPAFHLEGCRSFFGYLSHHCLTDGGRVSYRLWEYCSGVILPLMWQGELVQCIECRGDMNVEVHYSVMHNMICVYELLLTSSLQAKLFPWVLYFHSWSLFFVCKPSFVCSHNGCYL